LLLEQRLELDLRLVARVVDLHLRALVVLETGLRLALARVEDDDVVGPRLLLHVVDQLRVRPLLRRLLMRDQRLARQVDEQHDDDEGKESAAEESIHAVSRARVAAYRGSPRGRNRFAQAPSGISSSLSTPT